MKKTSSKLLSLFLVLVIVLSLTACIQPPVQTNPPATNPQGSEGNPTTPTEEDLYYNKEGYPICDETITITVAGRQGNTLDWNNTYFVKYVEEKLGIKLVCEPFPNDALSSQYAGMLATETMPDMMVQCNVDKSQVNIDGADGYWLDLSQYLDLMPNFVKMMEENPSWANYTKDAEGAIYSVNRIAPGQVTASRGMITYNKEVVQAAYPGEIKTIDDFYNALKAVKAMYPDKTPLAITFDAAPGYNADIILRTAFGITFNDNSYMLVEGANGEVELGDISEANRNYLTWLNKLVDEGLLSTEAITMTKDEYNAKVNDGSFVFFSVAGSLGVKDAVDYNDYGIIAALTSQYVDETTSILNNGLTVSARIFVSAKTEYPEAIARFIDFLCTDEGRMLAVYGEEGVTYDKVYDANGVWSIDHSKYADLNNYESVGKWVQQTVAPYQAFALWWNFTGVQFDTMDDATLQKVASAPYKNADGSINNGNQWTALVQMELNKIENLVVAPAPLVYTAEESEARKTLAADLLTYLKAQKVAFITGTVDISDTAAWDAYVKQVKAMGWDTLQPIEQAAWDRVNG